jgi:hypothetical protein
MGYFDALGSSAFKTGQDGRKLFFPWGVLGRCYIIDSDQGYDRLRRLIKGYTIVSMVLIVGSLSLAGYLASFVITGLTIGFYSIWMPYLLGDLKRSDERLSLRESISSQAQAHGLVVLWLLEIGALVFVVAGIFMFVFDPPTDLWRSLQPRFFDFVQPSLLTCLCYGTALRSPGPERSRGDGGGCYPSRANRWKMSAISACSAGIERPLAA